MKKPDNLDQRSSADDSVGTIPVRSEAAVLTREEARKTQHMAVYDDPMVTGRRSASGKIQWQCKVCGRITSGAERECYTFEMMTDAEIEEWVRSFPARTGVGRPMNGVARAEDTASPPATSEAPKFADSLQVENPKRESSEALERCDREIEAVDAYPPDLDALAYLCVMGREDWEHEKRLIAEGYNPLFNDPEDCE